MAYQIKTEQFEGPMELLVQLIESEKLDITRVSLAQVANQYLEYMGERENISLENLSHFLSVAAKLILIKSKALLPLLEFTEEEEEEIKDLEYQLEQFKKFKEAAQKIGEELERRKVSFSREDLPAVNAVFCPPEDLSPDDLAQAFERVLGDIPEIEKLENEVMKDVISLEERIAHLQSSIRSKAESSFSEIVSGSTDKIEVVVSFLALLELVKQKIIDAEQGDLFQDIKMKHTQISEN